MARRPLTLACYHYDRVRPLIDGRVTLPKIDLDILISRPRDTFQRMLDNQEFEASELSLASYAALLSRGDCPFQAIPVALSKIFRHSCVYVRAGSGIERPEDLKDKRVGTTQYGSTAVTYLRGMLSDEFGLAAHDMSWVVGGLEKPTEQPLIPLQLPPEVEIEFLPASETLLSRMEAGRLDALLSIYIPRPFLAGSPAIKRLWPNYKEVEQDYYRRTGIFPVMHTVVVRRDVLARDPWIAAELYTAFKAARDLAVNHLYDTDALMLSLPWLLDHIEENWRVFGKDFWSYGLEPNRPALRALGRYVYDQSLGPRVVAPEEIFPPGYD
jgi:4,5-dihydroxyphthalate decarboxylase